MIPSILILIIVLFVPGLFLSKCFFPQPKNAIELWLAAIPLSMLSHFTFSVLFVAMNIYSQYSFIAYFVSWSAISFWIWKKYFAVKGFDFQKMLLPILSIISVAIFLFGFQPVFFSSNSHLVRIPMAFLSAFFILMILTANREKNNGLVTPVKNTPQYLISLSKTILLLTSIAYLIQILSPHLGDVFRSNDAIDSWNRWALDWSNGQFPQRRWSYPQAIPALWATFYTLSDSIHIQSMARISLWALTLSPFFLFLSKYNNSSKSAFLIALIVYVYILESLRGVFLWGFVDFPMGAIALVGVWIGTYGAQKINSESTNEGIRLIMLGALCLVTAGLVKQGGVYFAVAYPFYILSFGAKKHIFQKTFFFTTALIAMLLTLWYFGSDVGWYGGQQEAIFNLLTTSENLHKGRDFLARIVHGFMLMPLPIKILILMFPIVYKSNLMATRILCFFVLPYLLFYMLLFSYSGRNATHAYALASLCFGLITCSLWLHMANFIRMNNNYLRMKKLGVDFHLFKYIDPIKQHFELLVSKVSRPRNLVLFCLMLSLSGITATYLVKRIDILFSSLSEFKSFQDQQHVPIADFSLYLGLVRLKNNERIIDGPIITNLQFLCLDPVFKESCTQIERDGSEENFTEYLKDMKKNKKADFYLPYYQTTQAQKAIATMTENGVLTPISGAKWISTWGNPVRLYYIP